MWNTIDMPGSWRVLDRVPTNLTGHRTARLSADKERAGSGRDKRKQQTYCRNGREPLD